MTNVTRSLILDDFPSGALSPESEYQPQNSNYSLSEWNGGGVVQDRPSSAPGSSFFQQLDPLSTDLTSAFCPTIDANDGTEFRFSSGFLSAPSQPGDNDFPSALWPTEEQCEQAAPIASEILTVKPSTSINPPLSNLHCMECDAIIDISSVEPYTPSSHLPECRLQKKHWCQHCDMRFNQLNNLLVHRILKHETPGKSEDGKHKCELCEKSFSRLSALLSHYKTHTTSDVLVCRKCRTEFEYEAHLWRHQRWSACGGSCGREYKVFCPHCSTCINFESISKHKKQHTVIKKFSTKKRDPFRESALKKRHECPHCAAKFVRPSELLRHLNVHTGERRFQCQQCDKAYVHDRGLQMHISRDHKNERHVCPLCNSEFKSAQSVQRHVLAVHAIERPNSGAEYECRACGCAFGNIGALSVHYKYQHGSVLPPEERTQYLCDFCGLFFKKQRDYKEHRRTHTGEREHRCKRCWKKYASRSGLRTHMETHLRSDIGDPTIGHRCAQCFKMLSSSDALRRHMAIHQQYRCKRCGKKLLSAVRLRRHERQCGMDDGRQVSSLMRIGDTMSHAGEQTVEWQMIESSRSGVPRPASVGAHPTNIEGQPQSQSSFPCRHCNTILPTFQLWQNHNRLHSGRSLRPHICWQCHKAFSSLQQLSRHKMIHSRDRQQCAVCQIFLPNKMRWLEHMNTVHPDVARNNYLMEQRALASASVQSFRNVTGKDLAEGLFRNRAQSADPFNAGSVPPVTSVLQNSMLGGGDFSAQQQAQVNSMAGADPSFFTESTNRVHQHGQNSIAIAPVVEQDADLSAPVARVFKYLKEQVLRCTACQHAYASLSHLVMHLIQSTRDSHHGFAVFNCPVCSYSASGSGTMARHLQCEHGVTQPLRPVPGPETPTLKTIIGDECSLPKRKPQILQPSSGEEIVGNDSELLIGVTSTERQVILFTCKVCGKEFQKRSDVKRHINTHTGEKPYTCEICERKFSDARSLKRHAQLHQRCAEDEAAATNHKCAVCDKEFLSLSALKLHLRVHTGERPLACSQPGCFHTFRTSAERRSHLKWHKDGCPAPKVIIGASSSTCDALDVTQTASYLLDGTAAFKDTPVSSTVTAQLNRRTAAQLRKTVAQLSTVARRSGPVVRSAGSAFAKLPKVTVKLAPAAETQIQGDVSVENVCFVVGLCGENRFEIKITRGHNTYASSEIHVCVPVNMLRQMTESGLLVACYQFPALTLCISPKKVMTAFETICLPTSVACPLSGTSDDSPDGRMVWVRDNPAMPNLHPGMTSSWTKACTVCDLTFASEEESLEHFGSEDHETAMLTMDRNNPKPLLGPSLSAGGGPSQRYQPVEQSGCACQICGARYLDVDLLVAHIGKEHSNDYPRQLGIVRPAARTAPLH